MLNTIKKIFKIDSKKKKVKSSNFFDLPSEQQKKIIKKAVREANKDQLDLSERYDKEYRDLELDKCSR